MNLEYSYDPRVGLIRIVGRGTVSLEDRIHFFRHLMDAPDLPETADVLVKVNEVTNAPSGEEIPVIGMLAERLRARFGGRLAIVNVKVGHVTISHLVAFSTADSRCEVRVFPTEGEAARWLRSEAHG